jgi:hypothetical protein
MAKRLDDAETAYGKAVAAFKASSDTNAPDFSVCLREYASVLRAKQRFNEAEQADLLATRIQVTNAVRAEKSGPATAAAFSFR